MNKIISAFLLLFSLSAHAVDVKTYIPTKAIPLLPIVRSEIEAMKPGFETAFMASAIEKESCLSLTHSRCWSPTARLLTYWDSGKNVRREHGQGLGQFTRTWHRDGSQRFDTLTELTTRYKTSLKGLNWTTIEDRPDLQIRAMVLLLTETWTILPPTMENKERSAMTVSAYNAGKGRLNNDRRTCKLKANCDPMKWFGHVEKIRAPGFSTRILYGKRTAWDVNREHANEVMNIRMQKYVNWYKAN